jgi:hypothetical protein
MQFFPARGAWLRFSRAVRPLLVHHDQRARDEHHQGGGGTGNFDIQSGFVF